MMSKLLIKRTIQNKIYWLAVLSAFGLLLCSIVYADPMTGEKFTFLTLFYKKEMQECLRYGGIFMQDIVTGSRAQNYLWMFAPIIVGVPCVLNRQTERFVLFRSSKSGYFLSKYISNLVLGGGILLFAQLLFALTGMVLEKWVFFADEIQMETVSLWNSYVAKRFWEIFCNGMVNAIPGIFLAEFMRNKYLILCIPFVWNYFFRMFISGWIPFEVQQYLLPEHNQVSMFAVLLLCGIFVRQVTERRCDCGQN